MTWVPGSQEYLDHLEEENVCTTCDEHFQSPSNLSSHQVVHLAPSIECYGCYRKFPTYSATVIHMESGACDSKIDMFYLNKSAATYYQWKAYIDKDYRDDLLNGYDPQFGQMETVYPFRCPECRTGFTKLSGLFQHADSKAKDCNQGLYEGKMGKLVRWLESQHGANGSGSE